MIEEKLERIAVALENIQSILTKETSKPCACPKTPQETEELKKPVKKVKETVVEDTIPETQGNTLPAPPMPPKVSQLPDVPAPPKPPIIEESFTFEETVEKIKVEVARLKTLLGKEGCEKAVVNIFDKVQKDATRLTQIDPEKYKLAVEEFQKYGR